QQPGNLVHSVWNAKVLTDLVKHPSMKSVAKFQSGAFEAWMPKLHAAYSTLKQKLFDWCPALQSLFPGVFCAATFNIGPRTVCHTHVDHLNLWNGACAITAFGNYNYQRGGHIVLHGNAKLIIEFPPARSVIIPSATIPHSNTDVAPHEARMSMTQYTAGGLFRFVAYGFRNKESCQMEDPRLLEELARTVKARVAEGVSMFSSLAEL
ncbi:hypothetical protein BD410DRAFT_700412, partial [Rickenella mellea]